MTAIDFDSALAQARELLAKGDAQGAFQALRAVLEYPCAPSDDSWGPALAALADISRGVGAEALADKCATAAKAPGDSEALYAAAYDAYEQSLYGIAASLLVRADALAPGQPKILNELCGNLEALTLNAEACRRLRAAPQAVEANPMTRYLLGFNALMSGDLETARPVPATLRGRGDADLEFMASALEGMLVRADALRGACPLDDRDLRGWHLVLNGCLLLHRSPYGLDDPMRGRYAYVGDSYPLVREGVERAGAALRAGGLAPASVCSPPGRSHEILAAACSRLLELPLVSFAERSRKRPCLIAVYDLDALGGVEVMKALKPHAPGEILFAHASCWTNPFPYSPDLTTFLYQTNAAPWSEGRMKVDPATRAVTPSAADEAPLAELAERVAAAPHDDEALDDLEDLLSLARAASRIGEPHGPGFALGEGERLRQRVGSPVPSARFR